MEIYLDTCCFNRPYDDQSYLSIYLETQAKLHIQEQIRLNKINLIWSSMLDWENKQNPFSSISEQIGQWRNYAKRRLFSNDWIVQTGKSLNNQGFGKKDALHLAFALSAHVDYFVTVDKGILRKKRIVVLNIVSPIQLVEILEDKNANR